MNTDGFLVGILRELVKRDTQNNGSVDFAFFSNILELGDDITFNEMKTMSDFMDNNGKIYYEKAIKRLFGSSEDLMCAVLARFARMKRDTNVFLELDDFDFDFDGLLSVGELKDAMCVLGVALESDDIELISRMLSDQCIAEPFVNIEKLVSYAYKTSNLALADMVLLSQKIESRLKRIIRKAFSQGRSIDDVVETIRSKEPRRRQDDTISRTALSVGLAHLGSFCFTDAELDHFVHDHGRRPR